MWLYRFFSWQYKTKMLASDRQCCILMSGFWHWHGYYIFANIWHYNGAAPWQKTTKWLCPAKTQISLGICPVWSKTSLCAQWVAKNPSFLHADSQDSDQTGWMPRLIWVFAGRTFHFVGFVMRWFSYLVKFLYINFASALECLFS